MAEEKAKELMKTGPVWPLAHHGELERFFDEAFRRPFSHVGFPRLGFALAEDIVPSMDIFEAGGDIVVKAELPGMKKEDIEVTVTDSSITISGEKKKEDEVKKKNYYKYERSYGSFCRTFSLPTTVKTDKVKSTFKDGILEIRMPKTEEAKSKEVKVKIE
jgi:HSP20 family protein